MKMQSIRGLLALAALTATMTAAVAAPAAPLPAPAAPTGGPLEPVIDLLSPTAGASLTSLSALRWSNEVTPEKYVVKFTLGGTSEIIKYTVPADACDDTCAILAGDTGLFDHVEDGQAVQWRVIATFAGDKVKTPQRQQYADTVNAPETLMPADGAVLLPVHNLTWNHSPANMSYTMVVKHADSGAVEIKETVPASDCAAVCAVPAFDGAGFPTDATLTWRVKAKGYNGDKAKSAKQTLTTPNAVALH